MPEPKQHHVPLPLLITVVGIGGVAAFLIASVFISDVPDVPDVPDKPDVPPAPTTTAAAAYTECVTRVLNTNKTTKRYNEGGLATDMKGAFEGKLDAKSEQAIHEVRKNDPALLEKLADGCQQTALAQNPNATATRLVSTKILVQRSTGTRSGVPGATVTLRLPSSQTYETDSRGEVTLSQVAVPVSRTTLPLTARLGNRYHGELEPSISEIDGSSATIAMIEAGRSLSVVLSDLPATTVAGTAYVQLVARFASNQGWLEAARCADERPVCDSARADGGRADFLYDGTIEAVRVFATYAGDQRELRPDRAGDTIRVSWKRPVREPVPPPNPDACDDYRSEAQHGHGNIQYTVVKVQAGTRTCTPACPGTLSSPPAHCSDSFAIGRR